MGELLEPPPGQRCAGRNYQDRRCCTPEQPCGYGEGDCDGPLDGGPNDGHDGCAGNLVCGSNNCLKFGAYYHPKDDCCDLPETIQDISPVTVSQPGIPLLPPAGQRCRGRNYDGKRCCTPENPCDEGEGDCDGPGDGGHVEEEQLRDQEAAPAVSSVLTPPRPRPGPATSTSAQWWTLLFSMIENICNNMLKINFEI